MAGRFSVEAIFRAIDRFSGPVTRMQTRLGAFAARATRSLASVENRASLLGSKLDRIGGTLAKATGAVVLPAAAAGAVIGKLGAEFEQAITNVGAVSLMTRDQIADLEKMALKLGSSTKFTATEVANGMEVLGRAGFNNQEILAAMPGVLAATAASGTELAETTSHISNVLKGMGLEASQATRVADVLALAEARTNSSISSLGESMANTAATARELGIPLEQVVSAVALLQDVGLDASVAGSAVNTMLTNLAAPSDKAKAQLQKFGVAFQDAKGNALPFMQILSQLAKGSDKAGGNMKRVAFFAELIGLRGQKAASNLVDLFKSGKVEALTKELNGAAGSAKKMADLRMQSLIGQLTLLKSAVETVAVALFNTESGPLRGLVTGTKEWVDRNKDAIVSGFVEYMQKIRSNQQQIVTWTKRIAVGVAVFMALSVAAKAVEMAALLAQGALWIFRGAVWAVNAAVVITKAVMYGARVAMLAYSLATTGAGGANLAFLATIAPIVLAIGAVIALLYQVKKLLDEIGGFAGLGAGIKSVLEGSITDMPSNFFKGIDEYQNKLAKEEAKKRSSAPKMSVAPGAPGSEWFSEEPAAKAGVPFGARAPSVPVPAVNAPGASERLAPTSPVPAVNAPGGTDMAGWFDATGLASQISQLGTGAQSFGSSVDGVTDAVGKLTRSVELMPTPLPSDRLPQPEREDRGRQAAPQLQNIREERKTEHTEKVEIAVVAQPGTGAKVTSPPKGKNVKLQVGASGTF